jgi:hypothetical protein
MQPTISLEMPVPSQGHNGFHSFRVVDWFCLFIYVCVLTFPLLDCSEFGNFVITFIYDHVLLHDHLNCQKKCKNRTKKSFQEKLSGHNIPVPHDYLYLLDTDVAVIVVIYPITTNLVSTTTTKNNRLKL